MALQENTVVKSRIHALVGTALMLAVLVVDARAQTVIVNPNVPVSEIETGTLRAIFAMRLRQWPNGEPVRVFVLPATASEHQSFAKNVLGIFPRQLERTWQTLIFSGTGQGPTVVNTPQEMASRVAATPGSIGYIQQEPADGMVKVLRLR